MADTYIKISELEETTLADDSSYIPIDNGNHTYKIRVGNYNTGANATAKSYAEAAEASADDAETAKTAAEAAETETGLIRTATQQYATAAAGSAANAAASAIEASTYAEGAAASEANAEAAAQDAADYATLASDKATLAQSWAVGDTHTRTGEDTNNASYYANQAQGAYENALEQADAAGDSADAAASSASDAADSATAAAGSASDASDYATAASGSATAAATSATQSANSAGAAATSATNAAASATAASGSASTATTQANNAAQSATTAGGYATQAASSASDASGYATNAANSATAAAGSATTATNQATAAAASATEASGYADDAADSAADAAESAATFTTDDTLSIAGKAADAKAAGDMIAAVQAEIPELDNWLTTPGAAAEAKHTGDRLTEVEDDVTNLLSALTQESDMRELLVSALNTNDILTNGYVDISNFTNGAYIVTNVDVGATVDTTPVSAGSYKYQIIPVLAGEQYRVQARGANGPRAWAFTDGTYKLIDKCNTQFVQIDEYLTAPADGYLIVNSYVATGIVIAVAKMQYTTSLNTRIDAKTDKGYYDLTYVVRNNNNGYIASAAVGSTITPSPTYNYSFKYGVFDVLEGDEFIITGKGGDASRLWTFIDTNNAVVARSASEAEANNLHLIAPSNGKLCFNSYERYTNGTYHIIARANGSGTIYDEAVARSVDAQRNNGLNILSAFNNVTCCGDSLTASAVYTSSSSARPAKKRYPDILAYKIGATAEILAVSGASASQWWDADGESIASKDNQLIIIYLGTNGGLTDTLATDAPGDDYTQYANTNTGCYCKGVAKALSVGARVLLIKIHKGAGGNVYTTNDVIGQIAEKFKVAVVDVPFLSEYKYRAYPDDSGSDSTHYNDLGYAAFADSLLRNVGYLSDEMMVRLIPQ